MNLSTKLRVRRSQWKLMKTTELIIEVMNHFEEKKYPDVPDELQQPQADTLSENPITDVPTTVEEAGSAEEPVLELVDDPDDSNSENEDDEEEEVDGGIASRTRQRTGTQTNPPHR